MFQALETSWDQSARRGWTTLASFSMQAFAVSMLLAIPILTIQGPPRLAWIEERPLVPPPGRAPRQPAGVRRNVQNSEIRAGQLLPPQVIPNTIERIVDRCCAAAPDDSGLGVEGATGRRGVGIAESVGDAALAPPPIPAHSGPLKVSDYSAGNLVYRLQPAYPRLAQQAHVQGTVELRAIISKTGTIENLAVLSGHAMLVGAAVEAVKHWRYRPYMLNGEPIEVETEITVNFTLGGS